MKILYDGLGFNETHGGVSRYFTQMIRHLPPTFQTEIAVGGTCNTYLAQPPFNVPYAQDSYFSFLPGVVFRGKHRLYDFATKALPLIFHSVERRNDDVLHTAIARGRFDVLHLTGPHFVGEAWRAVCGKKPIVITVHDLIPEKFGLLRGIQTTRREILTAASQIIAVSNCTKRDLQKFYNVPEEKITVVYHGEPEITRPRDANSLKGLRYILYVGKRTGYKNFDFFIRSVAKLLCTMKGLKVLCVGDEFNRSEKLCIKELGVEDCVLQTTADDNELADYYRNAICYVGPSLDEGFGLPILEAFSNNCPVLLSDIEVFHEIAGDAAIYFRLGDSNALCGDITALCDDLEMRAKYIVLGQRRLELYSWERCAQATSSIYQKVMGR